MSLETQKEIARVLRPFIEAQGFEFQWTDEEEALTLHFRRVAKPEWHFLSLQFDKHGRDRFVLEAGKCTDQGVMYFGQHYSPDQVSSGHLSLRARLQPGKGHSTSNWFRTDSLRDLFRAARGPERALQEVKSLFPEIDRWLRTGQVGEHIQAMDLTRAMEITAKPEA